MKPAAALQTNGPQLSKRLKRDLDDDDRLNDDDNNDNNCNEDDNNNNNNLPEDLYEGLTFEGMFQFSYSIVY